MDHLPRVVCVVPFFTAGLLFAQAEPPAAAGDDLAARLQAALTAAHADADVPAVSAAVARGGKIVWAAGIGVRQRVDEGEPGPARNAVDEHTRFQAASISKPVTAMAVLRLCADGVLDLDTPIVDLPGALEVARGADTGSAPLTLRRLLSHTGGTTVHGFPGYAADATVPDLAAVLAGEGNTDKIEIDTEPGSSFRYSGGGYCIVQQVLVAAREAPFAELMQELVLQPAGMTESTFAQPLPSELSGRAACAHDGGGLAMGSPAFVYPEQAAAGLWTTPSDLVRALLAADAAERGDEGAILPQGIAAEMLTVQEPSDHYGLGWMVRRGENQSMFGHGGGNQGFLCDARVIRMGDETLAYAVMINSEQGDALQRVVRALMAELQPRQGR